MLTSDPKLIPQALELLVANAHQDSAAQPLSLGMEASLNWSNDVFKEVAIGPASFIPDSATKLTIAAQARLDLGVVEIPAHGSDIRFSPGKAKLSASAEMVNFKIKIVNRRAILTRFGDILGGFWSQMSAQ